MTPRMLWIDEDRAERLRQLVAEGEPTAAGVAARAKALADQDPRAGDLYLPGQEEMPNGLYGVACAVSYLLTGEADYARKAHDYLLDWTATPAANLGRGTRCLIAAVVHQCCYAGWDDAQRLRMTDLLVELHRSFYTIGAGGDPHNVTNNHWGVSHAGSAIAAMAAHGCPAGPDAAPVDLSEGIAWALGRLRPYLAHTGDHGFYHEGIGYGLYPSGLWWPAVLAARRTGDADLLAEFPNLRRQAAGMFSLVALRPATDEQGRPTPRQGQRLSWNDDGTAWANSNVAITMIAAAPDEQKPALRWMFDRLNGAAGDGGFAPQWAGWFFILAVYPFDVPAVQPDGILPRHLVDWRQGMVISRNRYRGGDDAILGLYGRQTFVGGHQQDDAGSLRFQAAGHDWILGGGQARPDAAWQSVLLPADGSRAKNPLGCGALIGAEPTAAGSIAGVDLRKVNNGYCERWAATRFDIPGVEAAVAVLDLADDHLGRDWLWTLTYGPELEAEVHCDGRGFSLAADDGAQMEVRLLGTAPRTIRLERMPDTSRTFQSGDTRHDPGRPFVRVEYAATPHLGVYAVMAVTRGAAARIEPRDGLTVAIDGHPWRRPFGAAIPDGFVPGVSGTLCRHPHGRPLEA